MKPDPEVERERTEALEEWKAERDDDAVETALAELPRGSRGRQREHHARDYRRRQGRRDDRRMGRRRCATSFGDYRGPTGVGGSASGASEELLATSATRVDEVSDQIGHRIRILVGKPGLDGHSNGAEQIAVRARDVGMEVVYQGIRLTPEQIADSAAEEDVDVVGLSILSGSHLELIPDTVRMLREGDVDVPVVVGGIIPAADAPQLLEAGVAARLHAEGLRHQRDHGRDRRPRSGAGRNRRARRFRRLSARS